MPILLVFALTAACLPVDWPRPRVGGGPGTAAGLTAAAVGLALAAAFALRTWVVRTLRRDPARKPDVARGYARFRRLLFYANLALVAASIFAFGWGWYARELFDVGTPGRPRLAPFAELAVPLPYFAILFGVWLIYYDADRALHRTTVLGPTARPFWTRAGYFLNHLRQFALLVMLPVMLFVTQQSAARVAPETTRADWYRLASVAVVPVLILVMPLLIKPVLGLVSMPAGPVRDRLEAVARRLHFRCTDFLLWPTHGAVANAMLVGLLPRVRYVIFTDRLLDDLSADELDAVLGHEVGHAKHGHIWLYAAFLTLSMGVLAAVLVLLDQWLTASGAAVPAWLAGWEALPPVAVLVAYIFLVFGYLSRRCERQADVYACRAVSCADPGCAGHDGTTVYPERAGGLCPTGIRTCARALNRVDDVNGGTGDDDRRRGGVVKGFFRWLRAWSHGPMSRRVAFVLGLIDDPRTERRFQRRVTALRWGLILGLAAALLGLGGAVGWRQLLEAM